jgi:peptidase E
MWLRKMTLQRGLAGGHSLAMGGAGFSMEADNPLLDDFLIALAQKPSPMICFVPTASADSASCLVRLYRAFSGRLGFIEGSACPHYDGETERRPT